MYNTLNKPRRVGSPYAPDENLKQGPYGQMDLQTEIKLKSMVLAKFLNF